MRVTIYFAQNAKVVTHGVRLHVTSADTSILASHLQRFSTYNIPHWHLPSSRPREEILDVSCFTESPRTNKPGRIPRAASERPVPQLRSILKSNLPCVKESLCVDSTFPSKTPVRYGGRYIHLCRNNGCRLQIKHKNIKSNAKHPRRWSVSDSRQNFFLRKNEGMPRPVEFKRNKRRSSWRRFSWVERSAAKVTE